MERLISDAARDHPVVMIFSCVGDGTPRCVNVQSAGQMSVNPFFGDTIKFWWQNSVPPASVTVLDFDEGSWPAIVADELPSARLVGFEPK